MSECNHPKDKRAKRCLACHARRNAIRNNASGVAQSDTAKQKRIQTYLRSRMWYVPEGMEADNKLMRNSHIGTEERKRIFGEHGVAKCRQEALKRRERIERDEY